MKNLKFNFAILGAYLNFGYLLEIELEDLIEEEEEFKNLVELREIIFKNYNFKCLYFNLKNRHFEFIKDYKTLKRDLQEDISYTIYENIYDIYIKEYKIKGGF